MHADLMAVAGAVRRGLDPELAAKMFAGEEARARLLAVGVIKGD